MARVALDDRFGMKTGNQTTLHWPLGSQLVSYVETREDDDGPAQRIPTSDEAEAPEAVECNICRRLLNGPRQYRDHVTGKRHRKNKIMGRCFRAWKGAGSIPSPDDASGEGEDRGGGEGGAGRGRHCSAAPPVDARSLATKAPCSPGQP